MTRSYLNKLTYSIVGAAIEVHKELGAGLVESVYHKCLEKEFKLRNIRYSSEMQVNINYKGETVVTGLRCDFLVEDAMVVELKAVNGLIPVHEAQLLTYMKLLRKPKGILINFNCGNIFAEGQRTYVNEYFRTIPER
ncbi:MAG TPA: GxxExxY protein [Bacteroidia bacterium]|nr:GxxExxY protein [Bacteroidia bacterium]